MMRIIFLLLFLFPILLPAQIKIDKAGDGWELKTDSALTLIQKYDSTKYKLLLNVCDKIEFWNGSYSTNDGKKTIVISVGDVKLGSITNLAAVIIHESLHLYVIQTSMAWDDKVEENMCYRYEFSFLEQLPIVEEWLWRHTLQQIIETE
jgi:hypothetical protein